VRACELEVPGDVSMQCLSDAGPVHLSQKVIYGVMMIVMVNDEAQVTRIV
jgi:hypothetical protein